MEHEPGVYLVVMGCCEMSETGQSYPIALHHRHFPQLQSCLSRFERLRGELELAHQGGLGHLPVAEWHRRALRSFCSSPVLLGLPRLVAQAPVCPAVLGLGGQGVLNRLFRFLPSCLPTAGLDSPHLVGRAWAYQAALESEL